MGWRRLGLPPACAAASEGHRARATARNNSAHATEVGRQTSGAAQSTHGGANLTFHRPASTCKVMPWLIYLPHSPHANVLCQRHAHYLYGEHITHLRQRYRHTLLYRRTRRCSLLGGTTALSPSLRPPLQTERSVLR
ncbi:hypothetical protein V8C26DRAFT_407340, partial [Trichoderma gracile]